jgi:iron complex outermembrane recepter protein
MRSHLLSTVALITLALPAYADDSGDIVVTGVLSRESLEMLQGTSALSGAGFDRALRGSIGETLSGIAGVSSTSFGPGASRPVLRGLQGERTRVLVDGIGSIDVSNTSADHAVAINPLIATRIEVLRGPGVLLYGSSALGGVVNILSSRLPVVMPEDAASIRGRASFGTAANEIALGSALSARLSDKLVLSVDASFLDSGDVRIGDFAESEVLRAFEGELGEEDPDDKGRLENSDVRSWTAGAGLSLITETGRLGFSVSRYDSNYGIPPGSPVAKELLGLDDDDGASATGSKAPQGGGDGELVRIDLQQTRVDMAGAFSFDAGPFDGIKLRGGWADYEHAEVEPSGEVGTLFLNRGWEGRLELNQRAIGGWRGAWGLQASSRDLEASGEEAFLPPNESRSWGVFTLQEWRSGPWLLEAGARVERSLARTESVRRRFTPFSAAIGASFAMSEGWRLGVNATRSARAPAAEELFADGPHAATGSFEVGNPNFGLEKAWGLEASLKGETGRLSVAVSLFWNRFDGFITEQATGDVEDDLPVFAFLQRDAQTYGAELEASYALIDTSDYKLVADVVADITRGRDLDARTPLPRIPAARGKLGLEAQLSSLDARLEVERVARQNRVTAYELPTQGYTLVNAVVRWRPWGDDAAVSLQLDASNLFDVDARRHASFLKDFAPLAGRDIRISARMQF